MHDLCLSSLSNFLSGGGWRAAQDRNQKPETLSKLVRHSESFSDRLGGVKTKDPKRPKVKGVFLFFFEWQDRVGECTASYFLNDPKPGSFFLTFFASPM